MTVDRFKLATKMGVTAIASRLVGEPLAPKARNVIRAWVIRRCPVSDCGAPGFCEHSTGDRLRIENELAGKRDGLGGFGLLQILAGSRVEALGSGFAYRVAPLGASFNTRPNAGATYQASLMGNSSGAASATFIALSTATLTPAAGDTTLTSEITSGTNAGLARAAALYAYVAPGSVGQTFSYTQSKTFTSSGAATVVSGAQFNASSAGTLFVEGNLNASATLATNDQLAVVWTVTA